MRIAIAHYSTGSDISGVTTWLVAFCHSLTHGGHEVIVHLHHFGDDPRDGSILSSLNDIEVETHSIIRTNSLRADTCHTLDFINLVQPDLFLPQCLHAHYFAAAHAGLRGLPWIFTMHSDDPDYWCVADALTPELHGGRSVCVSQYLAKQLQQQVGATKPLVIPCGIALPLGLTSFSDQPFRVVYSGRMVERQKCIHQVVQALILACEASSQIEALLFGDGPARSACEQLVHQAGFADRIRFYGRVPPDQVQWYLQSSQAILLMSEFEGLPVALLEAMATGVVPVVRAIDSGIPELVQHERTGLLVTNDPAQAASALVRLCREPQLWHQCSTQARTHVQNSYNSEHCVQRWMELIQEAREPVPLSFPIDKLNFRKELPWGDLRFQAHYTPSPSRWSKLRPRRLIGRLRRMAVGHSPSEGS